MICIHKQSYTHEENDWQEQDKFTVAHYARTSALKQAERTGLLRENSQHYASTVEGVTAAITHAQS